VYHMAVNGWGSLGLNLGIDFTGGTVIQLNLGEDFKIEEIKEILAEFDLEGATIQKVKTREAGGNLADEGVLIKTALLPENTRDDLLSAFYDRWPDLDQEDKRVESVGATVGGEQKKWSAIALALALAGMVIYITIRFELKFAIAAIAALVFDVLVVIGLFSILQMEVNFTFIAALLTIIGYSINDTIVIIDRIRENIRHKKKQDYAAMVDLSIKQSLARSINTSLTTLLALISLMIGFILFVGNQDLIVFVAATGMGVIVGTYSSIFLASPLWLTMKEREFQRPAKARR
ncbi:MAG: protein translocase subunit SecF, partial [Dethiobacteria bacterium]